MALMGHGCRRLRPLRGGLKNGAYVNSDAISRGARSWGQLMWGTYGAGDARRNSFLLLFFPCIGQLALLGAFDEPARTNRLRDSPAIYRRGKQGDGRVPEPFDIQPKVRKRILSC